MVLSLAPAFALPARAAEIVASGSFNDDLWWELDDSGVLGIYGKGAMPDYAEGNRPDWWYVYRDYVCIVDVILEEGVTHRGQVHDVRHLLERRRHADGADRH